MSELRDLPKIELHLHLEGAAPADFIRQIAQEKKLDLSGIFTEDGRYDSRDFLHFLRIYEAACTSLQSVEDYHRLTARILSESANNGVRYTEVFVCPDICGGGDLSAWRDYVAAISDAAQQAYEKHGIEMRLIATAIRHYDPQKSQQAALCAAETQGDFVVGFGLAGDENANHARDFAYAFDLAREAKLGLTAHAGEWDGPESIRAVCTHLRPARIGHGVRAIEDVDLIKRLIADGIVLEICPGSNIALNLYANWASHPIDELRKAGLLATLSTDDPPFFNTNLTNEYQQIATHFGWDSADFLSLNQVAIEAAFCDDHQKQKLREIINKDA